MSIEQTPNAAPVDGIVMPSLELALIRWSVVHRKWNYLGGDCPLLSAFLAGWCCRAIGATEPDNVGQFRDSFRAGWREADEQISIAERESTLPPGDLGELQAYRILDAAGRIDRTA